MSVLYPSVKTMELISNARLNFFMDNGDLADKENLFKNFNLKTTGDRFVPSRTGIKWKNANNLHHKLWTTPHKRKRNFLNFENKSLNKKQNVTRTLFRSIGFGNLNTIDSDQTFKDSDFILLNIEDKANKKDDKTNENVYITPHFNELKLSLPNALINQKCLFEKPLSRSLDIQTAEDCIIKLTDLDKTLDDNYNHVISQKSPPVLGKNTPPIKPNNIESALIQPSIVSSSFKLITTIASASRRLNFEAVSSDNDNPNSNSFDNLSSNDKLPLKQQEKLTQPCQTSNNTFFGEPKTQSHGTPSQSNIITPLNMEKDEFPPVYVPLVNTNHILHDLLDNEICGSNANLMANRDLFNLFPIAQNPYIPVTRIKLNFQQGTEKFSSSSINNASHTKRNGQHRHRITSNNHINLECAYEDQNSFHGNGNSFSSCLSGFSGMVSEYPHHDYLNSPFDTAQARPIYTLMSNNTTPPTINKRQKNSYNLYADSCFQRMTKLASSSSLLSPLISTPLRADRIFNTPSSSSNRRTIGSMSTSKKVVRTVPHIIRQHKNMYLTATTTRSPAARRLFRCTPKKENAIQISPYSSTHLTQDSELVLGSPRKRIRTVPPLPYKVLDAPELADDFYLNLVDWSQNNVLAVGLGSCVYLWDATSSQVTKLVDLNALTNNMLPPLLAATPPLNTSNHHDDGDRYNPSAGNDNSSRACVQRIIDIPIRNNNNNVDSSNVLTANATSILHDGLAEQPPPVHGLTGQIENGLDMPSCSSQTLINEDSGLKFEEPYLSIQQELQQANQCVQSTNIVPGVALEKTIIPSTLNNYLISPPHGNQNLEQTNSPHHISSSTPFDINTTTITTTDINSHCNNNEEINRHFYSASFNRDRGFCNASHQNTYDSIYRAMGTDKITGLAWSVITARDQLRNRSPPPTFPFTHPLIVENENAIRHDCVKDCSCDEKNFRHNSPPIYSNNTPTRNKRKKCDDSYGFNYYNYNNNTIPNSPCKTRCLEYTTNSSNVLSTSHLPLPPPPPIVDPDDDVFMLDSSFNGQKIMLSESNAIIQTQNDEFIRGNDYVPPHNSYNFNEDMSFTSPPPSTAENTVNFMSKPQFFSSHNQCCSTTHTCTHTCKCICRNIRGDKYNLVGDNNPNNNNFSNGKYLAVGTHAGYILVWDTNPNTASPGSPTQETTFFSKNKKKTKMDCLHNRRQSRYDNNDLLLPTNCSCCCKNKRKTPLKPDDRSVAAPRIIRCLRVHAGRVGVLAWRDGTTLATGGRDRDVKLIDLRISGGSNSTTASCVGGYYQHPCIVKTFVGHKQEICGMKWSPDRMQLATGGNDNKLLLWDLRYATTPVNEYLEHNAAIKAIAWNPHQRGCLVSGGGTADRTLRFWNTLISDSRSRLSVCTGSQICNLSWSHYPDEFVSTHGYSQNQIIVWKYPSLSQIAVLTGHTYRVLYLALSPDGKSIVTGAGDETLRFWNVFDRQIPQKHEPDSKLNLFKQLR